MNPIDCDTNFGKTFLPDNDEGIGEVTFTRSDGRTIVIEDVKYDSIGVDHGQGPMMVITLTKEDETIIHLPFIDFWTIEPRF